MSPTAWASFRKLNVGGSSTNQSLIGAGTEDAEQLLLSLPIISLAVPPLNGFVLDNTAIVSADSDVRANTSDHQYFSSDSVAVRWTWRVGHNIVRPNRLGHFIVEMTPGS
jgi:hypothetical protein